jgi:hypothetical protein
MTVRGTGVAVCALANQGTNNDINSVLGKVFSEDTCVRSLLKKLMEIPQGYCALKLLLGR